MLKLILFLGLYIVVNALSVSSAAGITADAYAPIASSEQAWQAKADEIVLSWSK